MPRIGSIEYKYLSEFIDSECKTSDNLINMQRFDWSQNQKGGRFKYFGGHHFKVDFSNSRAETGFVVKKAVFMECIFDQSMWWLAEFYKCRFINCSFNKIRLYNSRLKGKFYNCSFFNLTSQGEYFSFGIGSVYEKCIFDSINLRNVDDAFGVKFKDCVINGTMINTEISTFYGRKYALNKRFQSSRNLFCSECRSVKFIRCDLTNLEVKNVIFEKDIVYKDTKGRPILIGE